MTTNSVFLNDVFTHLRPAPGPEVIYLRHVERARPNIPHGEEDRVYPPPQFIVPLKSVSQMEGGKIHFETRIEPVGDPTMKIEWLKNGQSIEASTYLYLNFYIMH